MKRDIRSYMNQPQNSEVNAPLDQSEMNNIQEAVNRYGGKSDAELLDELKGFKQAGVIDNAALGEVAQKIMPMLNPEQQQRLFSVMQQLK